MTERTVGEKIVPRATTNRRRPLSRKTTRRDVAPENTSSSSEGRNVVEIGCTYEGKIEGETGPFPKIDAKHRVLSALSKTKGKQHVIRVWRPAETCVHDENGNVSTDHWLNH